MNKKFTFMVAALLMSSTAFNNAWADMSGKIAAFGDNVKIENGVQVYLADKAEAIGVLTSAKVSTTNYYTFGASAVASANAENVFFTIDNVKEELGGLTFELRDKDGNLIYLQQNGAVVTSEAEAKAGVTRFFVKATDKKINTVTKIQVVSALSETDKALNYSSGYGYAVNSSESHIEMYTAKANPIDEATELNAALNGEGFSFLFGENIEGDELFAQKLYAVKITSSNRGTNLGNVAEGLYLTVDGGKDLEEALADSDEAAKKTAFENATFIVLDGTSSWGIEALKDNAQGLKFTTVKGKDLSIASDDSELGLKGEGKKKNHANNAVFAITESDPLNAAEQFTMKVGVASGTYYVTDASANDGVGEYSGVNAVNIIVYKPTNDSKTYLTSGTATDTDSYLASASFTNSNWAPASGLVKENKNVVTIYAVDGDNKARYVIATNASTIAAKSTQEMESENVISGQWVVSGYNNYNKNFQFTNRLTGKTITLKLYATDKENEFKVANTADVETVIKAGSVLRFETQTVNEFDGSANFDENFLKGEYELVFNYAGKEENPVGGEKLYMVAPSSTGAYSVAPNSSNVTWNLVATADTIKLGTNYAYMKDGKVAVEENGDKLSVVTYNLKKGDVTLGVSSNNLVNNPTVSNKYEVEFFFLKNVDGTYTMKENNNGSAIIDDKEGFIAAKSFAVTTNGANIASNGTTDYKTVSFESVTPVVESPFYANFESVRGYISQNANKETGVVEGALAAEAMTFLVDTTGTTNVVYIAKKSGDEMAFMYNAKDSVKVFDEYTATEVVNPAYAMPGYTGTTDAKPMAVFQKATYAVETKDTLNVNGVLVAEKANEAKGIKAGLSNFQFTLEETDKGTAEYYIRNGNNDYLYSSANVLGFQNGKSGALTFTLTKVEDPTSNENVVVASEVKVIANNGSVVVKNAAGKNVVVSTILGQVVANEVLTSDNATINVPAGIVVVAVEGESFKVNVK